MRVLASSTTGAGHFNPMKPWLRALAAAGHEVLVIGPPGLEASVTEWAFTPGADPDPAVVGPLWGRVEQMPRGEARGFIAREIFTRTNAGAMLEPVARAIEDFGPDLVLRDPMELAAAVGAVRAGVRQVRVGLSLAAEEQSLLAPTAEVLDAWQPGTSEAITRSPYLTRFPASMDPAVYPDTRRYRLPGQVRRAVDPQFVYATLGTVAPTIPPLQPWYGVLTAALEPLPVTALLTVGQQLDPTTISPRPGHVEVRPWAEHADVLARAAAIVHHGGSGTVLDALVAGCPQVVVPLFADQPANAMAVARAGVGVAVAGEDAAAWHFPQAGDEVLVREAVAGVLGDAAIATRAGVVAEELGQLPPLDLALLD